MSMPSVMDLWSLEWLHISHMLLNMSWPIGSAVKRKLLMGSCKLLNHAVCMQEVTPWLQLLLTLAHCAIKLDASLHGAAFFWSGCL